MKDTGALASLCFLGKLDERTLSVGLESGLKQELSRMTPQDRQAEAARWGQRLQTRGRAAVDISLRLQTAIAPKAP